MDLFSNQIPASLTKQKVFMFLLCLTVGVFLICWDNSVNFSSSKKSSLCSCDKCLADGEPWFRDLLNESPEPFLSRMHNTSEETFTWWKVNDPVASLLCHCVSMLNIPTVNGLGENPRLILYSSIRIGMSLRMTRVLGPLPALILSCTGHVVKPSEENVQQKKLLAEWLRISVCVM